MPNHAPTPRLLALAAVMLPLSVACFGMDSLSEAEAEADPAPTAPAAPEPAAEPAATPAAPAGEDLQIFIAGNFDGSGTCRKHALSGCDIFALDYDLSTHTLLEVTPLATTRGVAEDFPVVDPAGRFLIHQIASDGKPGHNLRYIMLPDGKRGEVVKLGREPALSGDGTTLGYTIEKSRKKFGVMLQELEVRDGDLHLGAKTEMTSDVYSTEPYFLPPDNQRVAIYRKGDAPRTGQTLIVDRSTGEETAFSKPNGCAHGGVSPSGTRMFCQGGNHLYTRTFSGGQWGELQKRPVPRVSDPAFGNCSQITFGHAEFCASDDLLLATYTCQRGKDLVSAQLALLTWEGEVVKLLSRDVAAHLGHDGGEARSGVCRRK